MHRDTNVARSCGWGMLYGLVLATMVSLFVGVLAVMRGSDWNPTYHVSIWAVIRGYYVGGLLGGLAYGCLRSFLWGRAGGLLLGLLLGPVVYSAIMFAVDGPDFRSGPAILAGLLVGGALGWQLSKPGALG